MAKAPGIRLDKKGIGQVLKNYGPMATAAANEVADKIRQDYPDLEVDVESYTTDRGAASVMVKDEQAMELQLSDGLITKAAGMIGLEVKTK